MDNRRTVIAVFFAIILWMVYSDLFIHPHIRPPQIAQPTHGSSVSPTPSAGAIAGSPATPSVGQVTPGKISTPENRFPTPQELGNAGSIRIRTTLATYTITNLGGRFQGIHLNNYRLTVGSEEPLNLVSALDNEPLPGGIVLGQLSDAMTTYSIAGSSQPPLADERTFEVAPGTELSIQLNGTLPNGTTVQKRFLFSADSYLFSLSAALSAPAMDGSRLWLEWPRFVPPALVSDYYTLEGFTLLSRTGSLSHLYFSSVEPGTQDQGDLRWLANGDKYFMAAIVPLSTGSNARTLRRGDLFISQLAGEPMRGEFALYVGPKDFATLREKQYDLERAIDLGIFQFLARPLLMMISFFYSVLGNYGLAIIALTLLIKTLFLPLTQASFKSMKAMQDLQPEMKELRERVKDPTQLNQEMLALYKRKGVNPMGGCFPVLIQIPVFIGLYQALLGGIELRHAPFALWITDLSDYERFHFLGFGIPVMLLLTAVMMIVQQWFTPSAADPQQKKIMMIMPVMFAFMFIIFPLPSGLVLYMLVNTGISIIQQTFLMKDRRMTPLTATLIASGSMLLLGYVLTLIS